ncbi:MAG: hypothetical protein WA991_08090 [Ornithinimicrobium sp.]
MIAAIVAILGGILLIAAVADPEDRLFRLIFGLLFVASAAALVAVVRYTLRLRKRAGV